MTGKGLGPNVGLSTMQTPYEKHAGLQYRAGGHTAMLANDNNSGLGSPHEKSNGTREGFAKPKTHLVRRDSRNFEIKRTRRLNCSLWTRLHGDKGSFAYIMGQRTVFWIRSQGAKLAGKLRWV